MTSDIEARTEEALQEPAATGDSSDLSISAGAVSAFLKVSAGFLAIGVIVMIVLALKRILPGFVDGNAILSYGRLVPAATTVLLYGWLTIGLLGGLLYVVPRITRVDISDGLLVRGALGALVVGYLGGAVGVLLGYTEGRRYLEPILIFDLVSLIGIVLVARAIMKSASGSASKSPVVWYAIASVVWLLLTHIVGNVPGLNGLPSQLQTSFHRSSLIGLWMAGAAVAILYYGMPRLAGRPPIRGNRLSVLGIWSLGLIWALTAPAELTFSAAGDWLETIGVIFSIVLFLPLLVIATDLSRAMAGAWDNVRDRTALRYLVAAIVMLGVFAVMNLVQALRASSAVVGLTNWVSAIESLVLFGPFTFVLIGLYRLAATDVFGTSPRRGLGAYRLAVVGISVAIGAMAVAGVQTGFTWAGAANTGAFSNTGPGWISTLAPLAGNFVVQLVGLAVFGVAVAWALITASGSAVDSLEADPIEASEPEPDLVLGSPPSLPKVRRYAIGFFALAALMVFILPTLEREETTLFGEQSRTFESGSLGATGRAIYIQEGCVYCHTQQVRAVITDVGLGPVSVPGDYANESPVLIGIERFGPDLTHFGERADAELLTATLQTPREDESWSIMPSYSYLSADELVALSAYLIGEE